MSKSRNVLVVGMFVCSGFLLSACEKQDAGSTVDATSGGAAPETGASVIPAGLFVEEISEDAVALIDAKQTAAAGDRLVFRARIGGRAECFVDGRAVMIVTDSAVESCKELHDDACPTPWDYCCTPQDTLAENIATVQIAGADGKPVETSLDGLNGMEPLMHLVIVGTVVSKEDNSMVVNAEQIVLEGE